ncbi:MAG: SpoIID/LytB domain-containing protein, partial [Syntrophales bacterium]|nr:SpoIID/LytB domain-containing protein [Syntrophales bacterium]
MMANADPIFAQEPEIKVGVIEGVRELKCRFNGPFRLDDGRIFTGPFAVQAGADGMIFTDQAGPRFDRQQELCFRPGQGATFSLMDVTIGARFHWERKQQQTFRGDLLLNAAGGTLTAINRLRLEDYLTSVISSEMSAAAPLEMLKAHAVASRSWLMAMLMRRGKTTEQRAERREASGPAGEIMRWYGREDHTRFDVCADDHCQRYQGITKIIADQAAEAVRSTRGVFLVHEDEICDARYHKACGGRTDNFENTWEETPIAYLSSIADADVPHDPVGTEAAAQTWVRTRPDVYCNTADAALLRRVLPDFDQETADYFRWRISYGREELEAILAEKSGIDFGSLQSLVPVDRGPSGRIIRLRIEGSKQTVTVGKELEIRRWLSRSHLYSSAFCVSVERDA